MEAKARPDDPLTADGWSAGRIARGVLRRGPTALLDAVVVFVIYVAAVGIRTGGRLDAPNPVETATLAAIGGLFQVTANVLFDVYWREWSLAALEDLVALLKATAVSFLALLLLDSLVEPHALPYAALFSGVSVVFVAESALKLRPRWGEILRVAIGRSQARERVIVVGAGRTGQLLARDLLQHAASEYRIVRFVDDDPRLWRRYVRGIRVEPLADLTRLVVKYDATLVVIALANPPGDLVRHVVQAIGPTSARVRAVAGVSIDSADTRALRPLSIEELLERGSVDLDTPESRALIRGRRVLITGAAGSIGSELSRQVAAQEPGVLLLLDISESGLYDLGQRLEGYAVPKRLLLEDVRDAEAMRRLLVRERPDVIFHAAAYKHVPILESAVSAGIATNVIGTTNVLQAAFEANVADFVLISTDKAVRPVSVLGITKRFSELATIAYASASSRRYAVVRFGNVLGSVGSVVPLFESQIDRGGPITVTHRSATRFFMTIPEAVGLVIEAGAIARPGDLLVLDMGPQMSILELAQKMVRLRGLRVPEDIQIEFTGLRPGEKLQEELFFPHETATPSEHAQVLRAEAGRPPAVSGVQSVVGRVEMLIRTGQPDAALAAIREFIAGAAPMSRETLPAYPTSAAERLS